MIHTPREHLQPPQNSENLQESGPDRSQSSKKNSRAKLSGKTLMLSFKEYQELSPEEMQQLHELQSSIVESETYEVVYQGDRGMRSLNTYCAKTHKLLNSKPIYPDKEEKRDFSHLAKKYQQMESVEPLDELSNKTKASYIAKSVHDQQVKRQRMGTLGKVARKDRQLAHAYKGEADEASAKDKSLAHQYNRYAQALDKLANDRDNERSRIAKQTAKRAQGVKRAIGSMKEDTLNEISKEAMRSYRSGAQADLSYLDRDAKRADSMMAMHSKDPVRSAAWQREKDNTLKVARKRREGIARASKKILSREEKGMMQPLKSVVDRQREAAKKARKMRDNTIIDKRRQNEELKISRAAGDVDLQELAQFVEGITDTLDNTPKTSPYGKMNADNVRRARRRSKILSANVKRTVPTKQMQSEEK